MSGRHPSSPHSTAEAEINWAWWGCSSFIILILRRKKSWAVSLGLFHCYCTIMTSEARLPVSALTLTRSHLVPSCLHINIHSKHSSWEPAGAQTLLLWRFHCSSVDQSHQSHNQRSHRNVERYAAPQALSVSFASSTSPRSTPWGE